MPIHHSLKKVPRWGWDDMTGEIYPDPGRNQFDHFKTHTDGVIEYRNPNDTYLVVHAADRGAATKMLNPHIKRITGT